MTKRNEIESSIKEIVKILSTVSNQNYPTYGLKRAMDFIERINPNHPLDSVDILDVVSMLIRNDNFPSVITIDTLEAKLKNAGFIEGELQWIFKSSMLAAVFFPNDSSSRYDIIFAGKSGATSFPISVTVNIWSDMNENSSHDDDCPAIMLANDGQEDHSLDDIVAAQQACNCKSKIEYQHHRVFESDEWFAELDQWLLDARLNTSNK